MCHSCDERARKLRRIAQDFREQGRCGHRAGLAVRMLEAADELEAIAAGLDRACGREPDVIWDDSDEAVEPADAAAAS